LSKNRSSVSSKVSPIGGFYAAHKPYSPSCVEWGFSEVQRIGSLPAAFFMKMV
jgi:hypothetical protein